jgi:GT2 family glycosyltransferase/glycosyltransferase involved in cell wall biosynthesis
MPRPAHEILHPACPVKPAWGVFDGAWYLRRHADAQVLCAGKGAEAALLYYLRIGARLGHSPSPLFDEVFYLSRHPDVAELVREGRYQSGFDHYCQYGHRALSPHWLFDDALYGDLYEDMTLENLELHQCFGRYDHYLKSGQREQRLGHFLFDGVHYRARALEAGVPPAELEALGLYVHFVARLGVEGDELAPSIYFDPGWYVERHPGARAEVLRGRYCAAIHHYLTNERPGDFDPVPEFSESFYRRRHGDIAAAVEAGLYRNAYQQFVQYGCFELRQPGPDIDLAYYRDMNERVRNDLNTGAVRDAFAHLRLVGLSQSLAYCPPEARPVIDESAAREAFVAKARVDLALFARQRLDFTCTAPPVLSVILVVFNRFELTMRALASLRQNFAGAMELVVVDNASTDDTKRLGDFVLGATIIRADSNLGFLRAANLGLARVSAPVLLYLNNDVELSYGAVAMALRRLESAADIGAVGAKIIRSNGRLQEAGSIIWNEGTAIGYMRDASPLIPEANFVRDVDFCSAVFLLCRTALVRELGGFDEGFAPAYYEDADLCVRMIEAGYRVVYDPAVCLTHLEFGSASTAEASMALMRRGRRIFRKKHEGFLDVQASPAAQNICAARGRGKTQRVLFIEDTVPLRGLGSGFVRSNDIVHAIAAAGYEVHVFPMNGAPYDVMRLYGELPETAEVLADRTFADLPDFLRERRGIYDIIWVARTHNLQRVLPVLAAAKVDLKRIRLVLDTEAVTAPREAMLAALCGEVFDMKAALAAECAMARKAQTVLAVNAAEAALLRKGRVKNLAVLGTARAVAPTPAGFGAREGLLFVGAMHQTGCPNYDALRFYAEQILPALAAEFDEPPLLHVVGHVAQGVDLSAFAGHKFLRLHGELTDVTPLYNTARIFVAPVRFAAGTPYKLYEAAACGLPYVATSLLAAQLGWEEELLSADHPAAFAQAIARLYRDEALWTRLRENALTRIAADHRPEDFTASVAEVLRQA